MTFEQAPLGTFERSFGSLTMRLFAAVYLTMCLAALLSTSAHAVTEDRHAARCVATLYVYNQYFGTGTV